MLRTYIAVLLLAIAPSAFGAGERVDGNWWQPLPDTLKYAYVVGLFDGMKLGNNFSYWGTAQDGKPYVPESAASLVGNSFITMFNKYVAGVSAGQLTDGLNEFYKDFRNRRILVYDATWLVLNQIAGTPKATLDYMIENWRRSSPQRE